MSIYDAALRQAQRRRGSVKVVIAQSLDALENCVNDEGLGVPVDRWPGLFGEFMQGEPSALRLGAVRGLAYVCAS